MYQTEYQKQINRINQIKQIKRFFACIITAAVILFVIAGLAYKNGHEHGYQHGLIDAVFQSSECDDAGATGYHTTDDGIVCIFD